MSNRIDFYQPLISELSIPSGMAAVFVDGVMRQDLAVLEIDQGGAGRDGAVRLRLNSENEIEIGKTIDIQWFYNNQYPGAGMTGILIFTGQVANINKTLDGIEIEIHDSNRNIEAITPTGRSVELNLQPAGERFNISKTNIWKAIATIEADRDTYEVQTPYLVMGLEVGDKVVCNPDCRDVLETRNNFYPAMVEQVRMDFEKQVTQLKVMRHRIT